MMDEGFHRTLHLFAPRRDNLVIIDADRPLPAEELGVSRRTLARRLASEGLTFRKVLDSLRIDLAKRYLREKALPISETAWLLRYQETSAFSHAFKRWTGNAPKRGFAPRLTAAQ
jgi:AraC-like DNA-binding protein